MAQPAVVTVNSGSSSIKFAAFTCAAEPRRLLKGQVERIGQPGASLVIGTPESAAAAPRPIAAADHEEAAGHVADALVRQLGTAAIAGVGHRVVHGGPDLQAHQPITPQVLAALRRTRELDSTHLPRELALIGALQTRLPSVPQVACFDTAFHCDLPRVARLLPIPRRYGDAGVRRFGFHGLSYTFLLEELRRVAGPAADGRVILAHLGAGASMAAVHGGRVVDTTMGFTPLGGLVMGTRPGDLDPGLILYLARQEGLSLARLDELLSHRCGLLGVSETSADMRDLLARREHDPRAADAVALFCHQARKWIGALAASLGGLDTLVFAGGIGEHAPQIRAEICGGLAFLGCALDPRRNEAADAVLSAPGAAATVRVMRTDEEIVMARIVQSLLPQA